MSSLNPWPRTCCSWGFFLIYTFFISNAFISKTTLKLSKNPGKAKEHPETELLLIENYSLSLYTLHGCRHWGQGAPASVPSPPPTIFWRKNDIRRRAYSQKSDVPHTNSSMYFFVTQSFLLEFSWSSDNIAASNKKNKSKNLLVYLVSEVTI